VQPTPVFIFQKLKACGGVVCLAKESTQIVKSETQLRAVEQKDYSLMVPNAGGALSKTDQLKMVEDRVRLKEK
jgi:hypothetical protein